VNNPIPWQKNITNILLNSEDNLLFSTRSSRIRILTLQNLMKEIPKIFLFFELTEVGNKPKSQLNTEVGNLPNHSLFMKKFYFVLLAASLLLTSCASIVSKSSYPISIKSTPSEAKITITDKKGVEVFSGNTPATLKLNSGAGFFTKARYQVTFEKDGYQSRTVPVDFKIDGWYFGNLVFGGVIGLLIIDPATGAMYKLDTEFLNETLVPANESIVLNNGLNILDINELPSGWEEHLLALDTQ
jgi:hypothetical protein